MMSGKSATPYVGTCNVNSFVAQTVNEDGAPETTETLDRLLFLVRNKSKPIFDEEGSSGGQLTDTPVVVNAPLCGRVDGILIEINEEYNFFCAADLNTRTSTHRCTTREWEMKTTTRRINQLTLVHMSSKVISISNPDLADVRKNSKISTAMGILKERLPIGTMPMLVMPSTVVPRWTENDKRVWQEMYDQIRQTCEDVKRQCHFDMVKDGNFKASTSKRMAMEVVLAIAVKFRGWEKVFLRQMDRVNQLACSSTDYAQVRNANHNMMVITDACGGRDKLIDMALFGESTEVFSPTSSLHMGIMNRISPKWLARQTNVDGNKVKNELMDVYKFGYDAGITIDTIQMPDDPTAILYISQIGVGLPGKKIVLPRPSPVAALRQQCESWISFWELKGFTVHITSDSFSGQRDIVLVNPAVLLTSERYGDLERLVGVDFTLIHWQKPENCGFTLLDMVFSVLDDSHALIYAPAFTTDTLSALKKIICLIEVPLTEIAACNAVAANNSVLLPPNCPITFQKLNAMGYVMRVLQSDEMLKLNGNAQTSIMRLYA